MAFELQTGLPLAFQAQPVANPLQMAMAAQQFQAQRENMLGLREQREAVAEGRRMQNEQRQNAMNDQASLDRAVKPGAGLDEILAGLPGHMHAGVTKQWTEANEAADKARKAKAEAATTEADYLGTLAATVKSYNYDPQAAGIVLSHAKSQGHDVSQIEALLQNDPSKLQSVVDSMIQASPKQRELADKEKGTASTVANQQAALPGIVADSAVKAQVAAGTKNGMTPQQQATDKHEAQRIGLEQQRLNVEKAKPGAAGGVSMSDDAIDYAAAQVRIVGQNSGVLTRLNDDDRKRILNRVADQAKAIGQSPAATVQRQAAYKSDAAALTKMQTMRAAAESFESKAVQQAKIVSDLSKAVGRTKFPIVNAAIMGGKINLSGDKDAQLLVNAITTFSSEYAKIIEGSTGSAAGSSDAARKAAERLLSTKLSDNTMQSTLDLMQREMKLTLGGYDATIGHITDRMGGTPTAQPAPAAAAAPASGSGMVSMVAPDGRQLMVPADRVQEMIGHGAKKVGG
jgi:hypothetical protein